MTDQMTPLVHIMNQFVRPRLGDRHVFAYDQLMNEARIRELCPAPRFVMTARYLSKRWIVNDEGVAALAPRRDFIVHGVIWEISDIGRTGLDIWMGVPGVHDGIGSFARGPGGELISPEYYGARTNRTFGKATPTTSERSSAQPGTGDSRRPISTRSPVGPGPRRVTADERPLP